MPVALASVLSLALAASLPAAAAPSSGSDATWFYPGRGSETVTLDRDSRVRGLPVARTGALLARVEDPDALAARPEVDRVERLRGGVVKVWPVRGVDEVTLSRALKEEGTAAWAHPDLLLPLTLHAVPDDPFLADQWHLANTGQTGGIPGVDIDAETAWAFATGAGQLIAVLDSGVDVDHPDLSAWSGTDFIGGDDDSDPEGAPHGTACAGISAGIGDNGIGVTGVAWEADVYGIRLIGGDTSLSDLYDAFTESVDEGAGVLNNSWGFDNGCADFPTYATLADALDYAETEGRDGLGSVVVFAAGNGDCDITRDGLQAVETVLSVAASGASDVRESYSSFGPYVDVSAPSGNIVTTDISGEEGYGSHAGDIDYYSYFSGTSAAAPVVSGIVALMLEANPRLTAAEVREVLCQTAEPIDLDGRGTGGVAYDADGFSPYYGCGRVDAGAAVASVANVAPDLPVVLAPGAEVAPDRVVLQWEGDDADGDVLHWIVRLSVDGGEVTELETERPMLDLSSAFADGADVTFTVQAVDLWGPGPESDPATFAVVAPVVASSGGGGEDPGTCAAAPAGAGLAGLLVGLFGVVRRRR